MEKEESRLLVLEEIRLALQLQRERRTNMESKGGILLGFLGGILAIMMSGYSVFSILPFISRLLTTIAVAVFLMSIVCLLFATYPRKLRIDPDPRSFAEEYRELSRNEVIDQLLSVQIESFEQNDKVVENVARLLKLAHLFLAAGLVSLTLGLLSALLL
jgi:hypothetical protein